MIYGYGNMDLVVFALAICALAILIFCLFCSVISGLLIQRRVVAHTRIKSPVKESRLEAGFPNESGFTAPPIHIFPLVKLSWQVIYPDAVTTRVSAGPKDELVEEIVPSKRCKTEYIIRQFKVADVLGFCRFSWRMKELRQCLVLPQINHLKQAPALRSMTSEDGIPNPAGDPEGDRMEIRPYVPGDSVRNIMWKAYARNRQLNVRLAEKSVFHSQRTLAYLLSSPNDEAAAATARMALESGALGDDWLFGADGTQTPCHNLPAALEAIAASRAIKTPHPYGLDDFLRSSSAQMGTHCLIFAAAEFSESFPLLKNTMQHKSGHFTLILATDGFSDAGQVSAWQRLLLRKSAPTTGIQQAAGSVEEMRRLLTEIGQLVESILLIDRKTGHYFDQAMRRV